MMCDSAADVRQNPEHAPRVVELTDDLDMYTVPRTRNGLVALHDAGHHRLVLDLGAVEFCDSSGLGCLVGAMKRARDSGGGVVLLRPQERLLRVLRITGLSRVMPCFESLPDAVAALDEAS